MKFVSWNVNGLRAIVGKGFVEEFNSFDADFVCLQETKLQEGQIALQFPGYASYWNYAQKKGYSGTAIFTRKQPLNVRQGLGVAELDSEGRALTLEMEDFYLVTIYSPNSQGGLARWPYREQWENAFLEYVRELDRLKPVIICGDMNVAHQDIDLKHPEENRGSCGFSDEERGCFQRLLDAGFVDTYRHLYPHTEKVYSWWSYMYRSRQRNDGWRIDYFLVSQRLAGAVEEAGILTKVMGSDHCPVTLTLSDSRAEQASIPPEIGIMA